MRQEFDDLPIPPAEEGFALAEIGQQIGQVLCRTHAPAKIVK